MTYVIQVPANYGYVAMIALGLIPAMAFVQGAFVGVYRKPAKVPYPNAYATPEQVKNDRAAYQFNCAQRSHGQLLENMPQQIITMLFTGLQYPEATAVLGTAWVIFRAMYAYGYITSTKPNGAGRFLGSAYFLPQYGLQCLAVYMAFGMI